MKQTENNEKKQTYQPPRAEIIQIASQTVFCASAASSLLGNSTESVGISSFDWI